MKYKVIADSLKQSFIFRKKSLLSAVAALGMATSTIAQTVPSYVPTNGLVGWWPFNGNAQDESINTNDGTVNGATLTTDRFGNTNSAYSFDGVNDYIEVSSSNDLNNMNDFSITSWFVVNNTSQQFQFIVSKDTMGAPPKGDWDLYVNLNKVKFEITLNLNNKSELSNSYIQKLTWNHIAIIRNSSTGIVNMYINGVLEKSFTSFIPHSALEKKFDFCIYNF